MIGRLLAVLGEETGFGVQWVEIIQCDGTILRRSVGHLLMDEEAAKELARRVNHDLPE